MGHLKFMGSVLMAVLFAIAIITYTVQFANDNNTEISLSDDGDFTDSRNNMTSDTLVFKVESQESYGKLMNSTIESGDETTATGGQFKGNVGGAFSALQQVLKLSYNKIFGEEQGTNGFGIIFTALISFLVFALGLYIWSVWAGKQI